MVTEIQWSELQRDPRAAARLADEGAVRVRRRDGGALLLMREDRVRDDSEGSFTAARALRNIFGHLPTPVATEVLREEFPWIEFLSEKSRAQFVTDFIQAFRTAAELGQWSILSQTVIEWRSTAAISADPYLAEKLSGPVDGDYGPVPPPIGDRR